MKKGALVVYKTATDEEKRGIVYYEEQHDDTFAFLHQTDENFNPILINGKPSKRRVKKSDCRTVGFVD